MAADPHQDKGDSAILFGSLSQELDAYPFDHVHCMIYTLLRRDLGKMLTHRLGQGAKEEREGLRARPEVICTTLENLFGLLINGYGCWVFLETFKIALLFHGLL